VDYAETRTGLRELLAAAADGPARPDIRVLLLARSGGGVVAAADHRIRQPGR